MMGEADRRQILAALEMKRRLEDALSLAGRYVEKKKLADGLSHRALEYRQKAMSERGEAGKLAKTACLLSQMTKIS